MDRTPLVHWMHRKSGSHGCCLIGMNEMEMCRSNHFRKRACCGERRLVRASPVLLHAGASVCVLCRLEGPCRPSQGTLPRSMHVLRAAALASTQALTPLLQVCMPDICSWSLLSAALQLQVIASSPWWAEPQAASEIPQVAPLIARCFQRRSLCTTLKLSRAHYSAYCQALRCSTTGTGLVG